MTELDNFCSYIHKISSVSLINKEFDIAVISQRSKRLHRIKMENTLTHYTLQHKEKGSE